MNTGDIITYLEMCQIEQVNSLQRGMNYRLHSTYSVLLMSMRTNAPYTDKVENDGRILIYEGHDIPKSDGNPKLDNQPMYTKNGKLTQNGLFYEAAKRFQNDNQPAELVRVYEKIHSGVWAYNGDFYLIDAWQEITDNRVIFKFKLEALDNPIITKLQITTEIEHSRMIPSEVKKIVWQRDKGQCVKCGSKKNLHFDHIIPYSLGGSSFEDNIQILCQSCNLSKSDKIE